MISSLGYQGASSSGKASRAGAFSSASMRVIEKMREADRQKTMPDSDTGLRLTSLKYFIEIRVSTRSLMFDTEAFSKGDIFIEIMLPSCGEQYLCTPRPPPG